MVETGSKADSLSCRSGGCDRTACSRQAPAERQSCPLQFLRKSAETGAKRCAAGSAAADEVVFKNACRFKPGVHNHYCRCVEDGHIDYFTKELIKGKAHDETTVGELTGKQIAEVRSVRSKQE